MPLALRAPSSHAAVDTRTRDCVAGGRSIGKGRRKPGIGGPAIVAAEEGAHTSGTSDGWADSAGRVVVRVAAFRLWLPGVYGIGLSARLCVSRRGQRSEGHGPRSSTDT
ncbi:hypothetical protein [Nocardia carnea]|uniref:Transposase n=1 Tax=Nocardia carnea TaxID=37328 RepID=A0ABW7TDU4_9NOCA|nr:hypothetical protein [Nocardia carnea]